MHLSSASYLGSFISVQTCPDTQLPEYAFVGRSNVGKSSLINLLTHRKGLAHVSNNPGKTRTINLYQVDSWILADLPGYGYAKVGKQMRKEWSGMIMDYLKHRQRLICVFVLIDFRLPLQELDRKFIAQLGEHEVPFAIVYTKVDKVHLRKHAGHSAKIENALLEDWSALPPRFYTSCVNNTGREELLQYISRLNTNTMMSK
jgi:GTP-binding protein